MEKEILEGKLGEVGSYDLSFKDGSLCLKVSASHELGLSAGLEVKVSSDAVLDAIAKAIPGQVDDAVLGLIKSALKM